MNLYRRQRLEKEIELLEKYGELSVNELSVRFQIDPVTVRRDLNELSKKNSIERIYGGVRKIYRRNIPGLLPPRIHFNPEEKKRIAEAAVKEISPDSRILIGGGSTTYWLSKLLSATSSLGNLEITTTSIYSGIQLIRNHAYKVSIPTGFLKKEEAVIFAQPEEREKFDFVFIGVKSIHPEQGLSDADSGKLDREYLQQQGKVIVLADHTKFGLIAIHKMFDFSDIDMIITNQSLDPEMAAIIEEKVKIKFT